MNPERWQKVKNILEEVIEVAPNSRAAFLEKVCADDENLRSEVEKLLEFESAEADFLEQDAVAVVFEHESFSKDQIGRQIGNYKITGELGTGGMGAVFLAERAAGEFTQKTAVKLIKRGMDSDAVLRRFLNERQILAALEHPNIARLIDGGTTRDGLPFFVMEYVEGTGVLDYATAENLDLDERLSLFREVCAAVSFAHRNLVIHRDLKPSNILITKDGKVKLLDFGIAKLLKSDDADQTGTQMQVFTPEYASPEQVRGEKLTTATDVYSLGVILYELLTGGRPYRTDSKNIGEIIKAVCETTPPRPSSVVSGRRPAASPKFQVPSPKSEYGTDHHRRPTTDHRPPINPKSKIQNPKSLRGDLDNIVLKALRKEPERRYSSVEQLSEDIHRHQRGLPVSASKDTLSYRVTKFVSRNRVAVTSAALLILVLFGGVVGTTWQAIRAERMRVEAETERARAERRFENLRTISNSLVSEIERAIRDLPGSLPARKLLLDRAVEQLDALAADSDGNTDLQLELVWAYQNLGTLPDKKLSESQKILEKAVALTEKILAARPADPQVRERLAMLYLDLIYNSRLRGDVDYTLEYNRRAVAMIEDILRETQGAPEFQDGFWTVYYHYALTMEQLGKAPETIAAARKILPAAEASYRNQSPDADRYNFIKPYLTRTAIGYGLSYAGDYEAAIREFETALAACQAEAVKRPDANIIRRDEANIRLQLAVALEDRGDFQTAYEQALAARAVREKLAKANPRDVNFQIAFADSELFLGLMLTRRKQLSTALPLIRRALSSYEKISAIDAERMQVKILAARARGALGQALVLQGNVSEGLRYLRQTIEFYEAVGAGVTIDAQLKRYFAETLADTAAAVIRFNPENLTEARDLYRRSYDLWRDLEQRNVLRRSDAAQVEAVSQLLSRL
jgi:serine/threonine protein kinase/tetratricopeptide (TPR) repeat protein